MTTQEELLSAPKVKRTHCYIQKPEVYDISCPLCSGHNVDWSEFEKHIWCYDCQKDIFITWEHAGIFSGPIPIDIACMMGISFDRVNIETNDVLKYDPDDSTLFNNTFIRDEDLIKYQLKFLD